MHSWHKTAGLFFLLILAVYSGQAKGAESEDGAMPAVAGKGGTSVKVLEEAADPFVAQLPSTVTQLPATQPAEAAVVPVDPAPSAGQSVSKPQVNVSNAGTVEIHVNDANLIEVLRMLSLQAQKNIIASKDVRGTVTANLYDVTLREALSAILTGNGYAYREKGNFIYVYTAKELADIEKAERKTVTETFRLFYTPAANAITMVKPVMSTDGQAAFTTPALTGIGGGGKETGGNNHATEDLLVVTDYPENIERIRKILKEVDRRPQQILIEATILRASLGEDNSLGVDFTVMGGVDFSTLTAAQSNTGEALSGTIINNANAGGVVQNGLTGAGTGFTQGLPAGGLQVGLITNNIGVFVNALEAITDTVVLANPKVLALNKQSGEVIVGRRDGYYTTTVTQTSTVQSVEFLDTGTRLVFRPYIGDDGFIRMEIHPEDSSGGLNDKNLPFKVTTEVTSNIMVRDGHTIVIGGLFREDNSVARSQIPFLGNLPLAGPLFRRQRDRTTREEVIILLTPHIVKDEQAYAQASEEMLNDAEKIRVGIRHGMMCFGRERLAECAYEKARAEMDKPNPDRNKAIWYLNCATNLNPTFLEAINLKQSVSGREVTSVDNSSIRYFVRQQILDEQANPPATTQPCANPPATTQPCAKPPATTQPSSDPLPTTQPQPPTTNPTTRQS